ncbi:hypothetical protein V8E54_011299 [Elaphomyces granulatus]
MDYFLSHHQIRVILQLKLNVNFVHILSYPTRISILIQLRSLCLCFMIGGIPDFPAPAHPPEGKVVTNIEMLDLGAMLILTLQVKPVHLDGLKEEAVDIALCLEDSLLKPCHLRLDLQAAEKGPEKENSHGALADSPRVTGDNTKGLEDVVIPLLEPTTSVSAGKIQRMKTATTRDNGQRGLSSHNSRAGRRFDVGKGHESRNDCRLSLVALSRDRSQALNVVALIEADAAVVATVAT